MRLATKKTTRFLTAHRAVLALLAKQSIIEARQAQNILWTMKRKIATKSVELSNEDIQKNHREKERRAKLLIALFCVALSAIAVVPFFFLGHREAGASLFELRMPTTHDMFLHYDQMRSFYKGLAAGEIYPRWEEETNRGFGAPTTSYYPPGVYYLTSAFYSVTRDWVRALLDAHLLMMIAAAAAIYFYARQDMARSAAIVAMSAYIFLPYHLIDQYQRGAIAELLGFIWMPLILLFGERLMRMPASADAEKHSGRRSLLLSIAGLAASYGAFLWSHPPTAYQFTLAFGLYVIVLSIIRKGWKGLLSVGASIVIALGLSAVYLVSAALEQNLIRHEYISETWPYHKTYVFVHDLFNYQFHRSFFRAIDLMWLTGAVVIVVSGIVFVVKRRALNLASSLKQRIALWLMLGAAASFMMTKASMPLGKLIPKIDIGVFTWRMLSITTLVIALLAGAFTQAAVNAAQENRRSMRLLFGSLAGCILVGTFIFSAVWVVGPIAGYDVFVPEEEHFNGATIPATAPAIDPEELPDDVPQAELSEENGGVSVEEWKPQHRVIRADLTDDDVLLVRTFNFPGWTAIADGHRVPITTSEELGDMEIELPAGSHQVTLDFLDTRARRRMKIVTLCSFGVLLLVTGAGVVTKRRRVSNAQ